MLNILVVEDEIYARQSLIKQIREYDEQGKFRIEEAENGEQDPKIVLERMPDLILPDIRMPKMDGLELLRRIRETDSQATVMMRSAYSDFVYVKQSLKNGACDYLLKPISDSERKECLDKFLHKNTTSRRETMITGQDAVTRFIQQKLEDDPEQDFVGNNMFRRIFKTYQILNMCFAGSGQFEPKKILEDIENVLEQEMWGGFRMFQRQRNVWTLVINADQDCHFFPRKLGKILERNACEFRIGVSRVITVLYAMRFLKESGYVSKKPIRLIFGCDEEAGMKDVDYFMAHAPHPEVSFVADCGFPVCRGEKGILRILLEKDMKEGCIRKRGG